MRNDRRADRPLGTLIALQRAREQAAREALARAADGEAKAAAAEAAAGAKASAAAAAVRGAEEAPVDERPPAEVLQLQGRFVRSTRRLAAEAEQAQAARQGERVGAVQALERVRADWQRVRRARERFEEAQAGRRREVRRERQRGEEAVQDDRPPRGEPPG
jgi:hypothetical protein